MNPYYVPTMPKEEIMDRGARDVSKYMMVRLFEDTMPDFKKSLQKTLGSFSKEVRETNPEMAERIDNIRLDNEGVMDIFYDSLEDTEDELEVTEQVDRNVSEGNPLNEGTDDQEDSNGSSSGNIQSNEDIVS